MNLKDLKGYPEKLTEWVSIAELAGVDDIDVLNEEIKVSLEASGLERGTAYFFLEEEKVVATGFLKKTVFDTDTSCTIFHVAVLPQLRRKGIGRELMEELFKEAKSQGKSIVILFTTSASKFYESCGMIEFGVVPNMVDGKARHFFYKNI